MKKGLRPIWIATCRRRSRFEPTPDEKGIKTDRFGKNGASEAFRTPPW